MPTDSRFDGPGPDEAWQGLLAQGTFAIQRCAACGTAQFPPGVACRRCGAGTPAFEPASGRGTVYSTTTVRSREGGHNVAIVALDEGPRLMSRVSGDPERVAIGQAVRARVVAGETPMVVFDPETAA